MLQQILILDRNSNNIIGSKVFVYVRKMLHKHTYEENGLRIVLNLFLDVNKLAIIICMYSTTEDCLIF